MPASSFCRNLLVSNELRTWAPITRGQIHSQVARFHPKILAICESRSFSRTLVLPGEWLIGCCPRVETPDLQLGPLQKVMSGNFAPRSRTGRRTPPRVSTHKR